jgi:hypothetical protein
MSKGPTLVVKFGTDVATDAVFIAKLDDTMNVDAKGKVKTQFYPKDPAYFWLHYDRSKLQVTAVRSTAGQVVLQGSGSRQQIEEKLFEDLETPVEFECVPSGGLSIRWYGRETTVAVTGRSALATTNYPCHGKVTYGFNVDLGCLLPPAEMVFDTDDEGNSLPWPIDVVIYVDNKK